MGRARKRVLLAAAMLALAAGSILPLSSLSYHLRQQQRIREYEQTAAAFEKVKAGMNRAEVEALIGPGSAVPPSSIEPPDARAPGGRQQYVLYWNVFDPRPRGYAAGRSLTVSFYGDDDRVAGLSGQALFPQ